MNADLKEAWLLFYEESMGMSEGTLLNPDETELSYQEKVRLNIIRGYFRHHYSLTEEQTWWLFKRTELYKTEDLFAPLREILI